MTIRAKFEVSEVRLHRCGGQVDLHPVTQGSDEDKKFQQATPAGKLEMRINGDAIKQFKPGDAFYFDFVRAESKCEN